MVPQSSKMDTSTIRRVAPVAHAVYLAAFVIICGIVVVAIAADFRRVHNSVLEPTPTKTAAYQSHGKTLYVEPEVLRLAHLMAVAASISIGCLACIALVVTIHAKRKAGLPAP